MAGNLRRLTWAFALLVASAAAAHGQDDTPDLIALGLGYYDINQQDDAAADFRLEYRAAPALWKIRPWAGLEATSDGAVYGLGGILLDFELGPRIAVTPGFGVGAYHDGGGKDLGSVLEFRSQIELAYRFHDRSRLALAFSHISNASVASRNPGTEILTLYYMVPLERIF